MEISGPGDVIQVGGKGESAVENDTQALDLRGGWTSKWKGYGAYLRWSSFLQ